ncbi:predicted protein [Sclerotinia sclerotiorum 1980 UF-70]|uniref:Uncharacterized protein n=1 Tax=Sclerotinia sclerotiorum (strain ATCC 18683 / 1980 / Ss-1) TaxID=665079 RepID=A7EM70_SCLS1|nr:predicted protein [Sclerotinia sclerotiorum 1980 UF-70]EDO03936.1 predicted protein [Sclerotinia sclerotiorum 1980 UF-70]
MASDGVCCKVACLFPRFESYQIVKLYLIILHILDLIADTFKNTAACRQNPLGNFVYQITRQPNSLKHHRRHRDFEIMYGFMWVREVAFAALLK